MMKARFLGTANRPHWWAILAAFILLFGSTSGHSESRQDGDRLVYVVSTYGEDTTYMLYDAYTRKSTPIITDPVFGGFSFSVDGRLAFLSRREGNGDIYVLDTSIADSSLINITQTPAAHEFPVAWSRDGSYLAFMSYHDHDEGQGVLYVWNGETAINITPDVLVGVGWRLGGISWSFDRCLAFTVWYDSAFVGTDKGNPSEIYLWDGYTTTDLSQTPTGDDRMPTWNADGEVAFITTQGLETDIFIWDGVSVKNGTPNRNTFVNVEPELTELYSTPTWTNDGQLAFEGIGPKDDRFQIYVWDGQTATNVSLNPTEHNLGPKWSADGRWAFWEWLSSKQSLHVRDADNAPLLTVEGQYPSWSPGGYLMFCRYDRPEWALIVWDGQDTIEVARGGEIRAEWQGGGGVSCSSG